MPPARSAGRGPGDRIRLAQTMREARRRLGLSGAEAGRRAAMSQSKVSKIERGFLLPSLDDVEVLSRVYELPADERDELVALVVGLREEASARVILARGVAEMQRKIGQLEASATLIRSFQPTMVIGLLQTSAYMRYVFGMPVSPEVSAEEVVAAVSAREARQRVLDDRSKQFVLIMTEGSLRWHVGSACVMKEQVEAIAETAKRPNVRVGIIPWTTPVQLFPRHGFHLYDADAVIVGTETATATMTGAADVTTYIELFDALEMLALFGDAAQEHFARIANEYCALASV
ncbi:helix-turn-helix domain-containing protein [Nonomuraea endophytica]|uniref:helix-turn-helix domain-containing protein n=1 Tax=Nonomuraea endophytica TaxID=714136 RepID=UPI0037CB36F9